jgi:anti-sigma-K factor RskA
VITFENPEERAATAGEYVMGTLSADEHAAVAAALAASLPGDAALQADVYAWQDRLLSLSAKTAAVAPSATLWRRIDVAINAVAAATPRVMPATPRTPWWQTLRLWQGVSALALAFSLVMAVVLVGKMTPEAPGARYLAVLQSPDKQATGWVVELQAGGSLRLVPVADSAPVPAGRTLQFWTKAQGASAPTSLGLVPPDRVTEIDVASLPTLEGEQLFELTLEPETGSPIGRPTGPILYLGRTVIAAAK